MSTHEDFVQAIVANPDEDALRQIYTDWLEEQGESERADFIRGRCELPQLQEGSRRHRTLSRRFKALEERHQKERLPLELHGDSRHSWERGLLERL
jgi:uncharacterized protein (TIGR02996 family)